MADLIPYPLTDYNSYGTVDEAEFYFESRLHSDSFLSASYEVQAASLITGFQSIAELDLNIDLENDGSPLEKLTHANFEQALYELQNDLDVQQAISLNLSGLAVKMPDEKLQRYSPRALALLRPYLNHATENPLTSCISRL